MTKQQRQKRCEFPDTSDGQAVLLQGILMKNRRVFTIQKVYTSSSWKFGTKVMFKN